jgi:hypothetical protein
MKGTSAALILILILITGCATSDSNPGVANLDRKLKQCYEESDTYTQKLPGNMQVQLTIDAEGRAGSFKILASTFPLDRNLEACVTGQLRAAIYPRPASGKPEELIKPVNFIPGIQ